MKRVVAFLFAAALAVLLSVPCAADRTVSVEEFEFTVTMPDDCHILSRDREQTAEAWGAFDEERQARVMQNFLNNDVYVNAVAKDLSYEIVLSVRQGEDYYRVFDLAILSDEQIASGYAESFRTVAEQIGIDPEEITVYSTGNLKYVRAEGVLPNGEQKIGVIYYTTIVNGISLQCNFKAASGTVSEEQRETMQSVVDSICFKEIKTKPDQAPAAGERPASGLTEKIVLAAAGGITAVIGIPAMIIGGIRKGKKNRQEEGPKIRYACSDCGHTFVERKSICPFCGAENSIRSIYRRHTEEEEVLPAPEDPYSRN